MKQRPGFKTYVCTLAEGYMAASAYHYLDPKKKAKLGPQDWENLANRALDAAKAFEAAALTRGEIQQFPCE